MNRRRFFEICSIILGALYVGGCRKNEAQVSRVDIPPRKTNGRSTVLRITDDAATSWNYQNGRYIDSINAKNVHDMFTEGLLRFTNTKDIKSAWFKILHPYDISHTVLLKPNLNNPLIGYGEAIMTSPPVIQAVVQSLVEAGIPPAQIVLYDLSSQSMPEIERVIDTYGIRSVWGRLEGSLYNKISLKLNWGDDGPDLSAPVPLRHPITLESGELLHCYLPKVLTKAHHLINLPVFKAHQFVVHSSALKNHFGTVRYSNKSQYPSFLHGTHIQSHIVDINAHPAIAGRTRLIVADALFGAPLFTRGTNTRIPTEWKTFPSSATPNSLFLSRDPIALESVLSDYIIAEQRHFGFSPYADEYLRDASDQGLGTFERRDTNGNYHEIDYIQIDSHLKGSFNGTGV